MINGSLHCSDAGIFGSLIVLFHITKADRLLKSTDANQRLPGLAIKQFRDPQMVSNTQSSCEATT